MKVTGFTVIATLLAPSQAAPAPIFSPLGAIAFTAAGGLVLGTGASAITIPTATLLAGKAIALKGLFIAHNLNKASKEKDNYKAEKPCNTSINLRGTQLVC